MASFTLTDAQAFPNGTTVTVYPAQVLPYSSGTPAGPSVTSGTTNASGQVTFSGLADATSYIAYAPSPDRVRRFRTDPVAAWSAWTNQAWSKGNTVTWLGSGYVALNDVPSGGAVPGVDSVNWALVARGGGEIAAAEFVATTGGYSVPAATTDLPGAQVTVPAGAGAYELIAQILWEVTATAANGVAICSALIYDIDNAVYLANTSYRIQIPVSGQLGVSVITAKKRMPASANPRNFKVQTALTLASATVKIRSDGGFQAPAIFQAKAL